MYMHKHTQTCMYTCPVPDPAGVLGSMRVKHAAEPAYDVHIHDDPGGRPYMEDRHVAIDYLNIAVGREVHPPSYSPPQT
jgi:hypothetical protein